MGAREPMTPEQRGTRAAWLLFFVLAGVNVLSIFVVAFTPLGGLFPVLALWVLSLVVTPVLGLIASLIITFVLPGEARGSFWLTNLICMACMLGVFGVTCGLTAASLL